MPGKLEAYRKKRDFAKTPEPSGKKEIKKEAVLAYVVQKHAASHLHWDFRLEMDGALKSWAVPKGPSLDPEDKRLAVHVEDHPLEYGSFEGIIPQEEYGGGTVMLWDTGYWEPEGDPHKSYEKGRLDFALYGKRLKGKWHLVRMRRGGAKENWLLIKGDDGFAERGRGTAAIEKYQKSAASGRGMEGIAKMGATHSSHEASGKVSPIDPRPNAINAVPYQRRRSQIRQKNASIAEPPPEFIAPHGLREDKPAKEVERESEVPVRYSMPKKTSVEGVTITNPEKALYPGVGVTKIELAEYFAFIADAMLPHVARRPISLLRCPDGIEKNCIFQRHPSLGMSDDIKAVPIVINEDRDYLMINDARGLLALAQMAVLEIHTWGTTVDAIDAPDRMVFDLDPDESVSFARVKDAAREVRDRLLDLGLESFVLATGGKGLHVAVPLKPKYGWDTVKEFSHLLVKRMARDTPGSYTVSMRKADRGGKIYLDYLRNGKGASFISPYSPRAKEGAPVAAPLDWDELRRIRDARPYTIRTIVPRVNRGKTPWNEIAKLKQTIRI
ncbi:MAG: non-homologous end-joining DNA ligase [Alphaproteobacteria bacterium]|nr:non-homologous end-joining DNA ligase [Alphaproteobacteria bacterium]